MSTPRSEMIDEAVRRQLHPQWMRHFSRHPGDLGSVRFRETRDTAAAAIRAEFFRLDQQRRDKISLRLMGLPLDENAGIPTGAIAA